MIQRIWPVVVLVLVLGLATLAMVQLGQNRDGLIARDIEIAGIPATILERQDRISAPVVVIAHGFAGSRQLMLGFAETLAQAGYITVSYDLSGHGANPMPMSGDVTSLDGTTRLLIEELDRVIAASLLLDGADGRLAVLGHSMASDIITRKAVADPRIGATIAISMFSNAVTATAPRNLLVINGAWETALNVEAARVLRLSDPAAGFGQTYGDPVQGTARRAIQAPSVEHVGVLYSATAMTEARDWLDASFARQSDGKIAARGGWIALLIVATTALAWPLARLARPFRAPRAPVKVPRGAFWLAVLCPMILTPLVLRLFDISFLPVLVADYLAVHFALFGAIGLVILARAGVLRWSLGDVVLALPVAGFCILIFGGMLHLYVASFLAVDARGWIILAIAAGAVPFMLADAYLTQAGQAPFWRVLVVRAAALVSLGIAVALDMEDLFFLLLILPIILVFFILFGTLGGWVGRVLQRPATIGAGLGLFLGWALAVTFPLFAI
jgi:dienelactone hydrolase